MSDPVQICTPRLILREFVESDFEAAHAYGSDAEVVRFMEWGPNTEQETRDFIARAKARCDQSPRREYELAVMRNCDGVLIGGCGLSRDAADPDRAMLGYCYDRRAWGNGYATEAATAVRRFGYEVLGLREVWAACEVENAASARVLEKLGMQVERRVSTPRKGQAVESHIYRLTARKWSDAGRT